MEKSENEVKITGLDIPFWDLVWFMVKLALASIPALFIIYFFFAALGLLFGGIFHALLAPLPPM
ncbi:hypothetical protein [Hydrogenimonas sp.]